MSKLSFLPFFKEPFIGFWTTFLSVILPIICVFGLIQISADTASEKRYELHYHEMIDELNVRVLEGKLSAEEYSQRKNEYMAELYATHSFFSDPIWREFCKTIFIIFLSGSFINIVLSTLKHYKYFEKLMLETLLDESYLERRKDIVELWQRISGVLHKKRFSAALCKRIESIVTENYFPTNVDILTKEFEVNINYTYLGDNIVEVEEIHQQKIKTYDKSKPIELKFSNGIYVDQENEEDFKVELKDYKITKENGAIIKFNIDSNNEFSERIGNETLKIVSFVKNNSLISIDDKPLKLKGYIAYFNFSGLNEFTVEKRIVKTYNLKYNSIKKHVSNHLYEKFVIRINKDPNLRIKFLSCGTINEFTENLAHEGIEVYILEDVILKNQGYCIGCSVAENS
ncbi:MAG: hypothetical protein WBA74_01510 [Cyclobacteriaceae bacterium]